MTDRDLLAPCPCHEPQAWLAALWAGRLKAYHEYPLIDEEEARDQAKSWLILWRFAGVGRDIVERKPDREWQDTIEWFARHLWQCASYKAIRALECDCSHCKARRERKAVAVGRYAKPKGEVSTDV